MTDIKFPKLVTKFVNGVSYTAIDKDKDTKTKSASIPKENSNSNKKPYWISLYEMQFGGIE